MDSPYDYFDVMRNPQIAPLIKRIQAILVYEGKVDGQPTLGGLEIEYELTTGDIYIDGAADIGCRTSDVPKRFELRETESLINVEGVGEDSV
jgi:hypothetical protein